MTMQRRVKIVTTLGPSVSSRERLRELLEAGADVVRVNAAHGSEDDRLNIIENVRAVAEEMGRFVPILFDLRGLKIRTGPLPEGKKFVRIHEGDQIRLVAGPVPTENRTLGINYDKVLDVISPGSRVLISDGLIELQVREVFSDYALATVVRDGQLLSRQGVTLPGAPIVGGALTDLDRADIAFAVKNKVDFLGLSFLNDADDLRKAREIAAEHGGDVPGLIAKIERPQALANIDDIAAEADGVMVARGDLGVQLPPEQVPQAQKRIISVCNRLGTPVITATQMLESMITQPVATRAETSDVANAVWDGTDAVMLSAETAVGKYPLQAVRTMDRIIKQVEQEGPVRSVASQEPHFSPANEESVFADAIARAAFALSDQTPVEHLVVLTKTGGSARRIAKYRPTPPIVAICENERIARMMGLTWGVESIVLDYADDPDEAFRGAGEAIIQAGLGKRGEYALIVGSIPVFKQAGRTNLVHFRKLGD